MKIRRAEESDVGVITEYNCNMARETEELDLDRDIVLAGVRNAINDSSKAVYYLVEIDGKVVGQLMITKEWSDWRDGVFWWIQSVYVHEEYRCRGVFRGLYNYVNDLVQNDPEVCGIRLYVEKNNKLAQKTYQNMGMKETPYLLYEQEK
ncbi:GNAT family N-acetyltransferase [Iocasia frigidifontis]|uniref:GNAT family N-acetyltransferase n=1 Tax=Iocasia fonsfrigidae TaxID=2682810 RepID=A0A8A7KD03_9FIRM|nr:N-acetyltransferase [Iocasia fonsfrigidae]QTL99666.1 GNAT family N-acetyltransferase [Iocasia fonsfrigidae]